jgi:hypothetical protein
VIVLPDTLWRRMLDVFAQKRKDHEQVAYLDGYVCTDALGVVTTLTFPLARSQVLHFVVTADGMSAAGKHLRRHRMRRLAQVHTHPAEWTGHSPFDDENAYSQRPGAVSIVLPRYARDRPSPLESGVHLRTDQGWTELDAAAAGAFIHVVPGEVNLRGRR